MLSTGTDATVCFWQWDVNNINFRWVGLFKSTAKDKLLLWWFTASLRIELMVLISLMESEKAKICKCVRRWQLSPNWKQKTKSWFCAHLHMYIYGILCMIFPDCLRSLYCKFLFFLLKSDSFFFPRPVRERHDFVLYLFLSRVSHSLSNILELCLNVWHTVDLVLHSWAPLRKYQSST